MTAIDWLIEQLIPQDQHEGIMDIIEEAKQMHKEEIIDAYSAGENNIDNDGCSISSFGAVYYYNETFKNN